MKANDIIGCDVRAYRHLQVGCLALIMVLGSACSEGQVSTPFLEPTEIVDLSPTITEDILLRVRGERQLREAGRKGVTEFEHLVGREPAFIYNAFVEIYDHGGAHADAPIHIIEGAASIDEVALGGFFGRARLLDFTDKEDDEPISVEDLESLEIAAGDIILAYVGYSAPAPGDLPSYPYLSPEAAEYLATIPIKAFASDMPSAESFQGVGRLADQGITGAENLLGAHYALLSRGIPIIESLVNLESLLGEENLVFVGFPLKLEGVSGGPMRAVALVY